METHIASCENLFLAFPPQNESHLSPNGFKVEVFPVLSLLEPCDIR